jgi:hypothetical protein
MNLERFAITADREIGLYLYAWKKVDGWYRMVGSFVEKTD